MYNKELIANTADKIIEEVEHERKTRIEKAIN